MKRSSSERGGNPAAVVLAKQNAQEVGGALYQLGSQLEYMAQHEVPLT